MQNWSKPIIIRYQFNKLQNHSMQANYFSNYPFSHYYIFQQYSPMLPYFLPLQDYNSSFQNCRLPQINPVKSHLTTESFHNPTKLFKPEQISQIQVKKIEISTSKPKVLLEKVQKFNDENSKSPKSRIKRQKEGRNASSNLLRMFFRCLQNKIQDDPHHIKYVISKYEMKINLEEFFQWIQRNKIDHRNYIRVPTIRKFFIDTQLVRQHTKIMRILFKDFLVSESVICYLTSKRVGRHAMTHNFHAIRSILKDVFAAKA